ncbi:hypothetical protein LSTR_LSTR010362 [Laodelphax striatellus]|uniref:Uncharacterized protein n=1 Tax=Laodelphax striatellus TaxID=195883 RepID=A0A482WJX1_LAOST|nr:hypothetical protein LSTR_LSTR010362 [Laodelphax striatellus]
MKAKAKFGGGAKRQGRREGNGCSQKGKRTLPETSTKDGKRSTPSSMQTATVIALPDRALTDADLYNDGAGTHWVCYVKKDGAAIYFDGFGNLRPPQEFIDYMHRGLEPATRIEYNYNQKQEDLYFILWPFMFENFG